MRYCHAVRFRIAECILVMLFLGCAHKPPPPTDLRTSLNELKDIIHSTVKDPARAARMQSLGEQAYRQASELSWLSREFQSQLQILNAKYDASPEDFHILIADFVLQRDRLRDEIIELFFRIRDLSTAQEWEKLSGHEKEMVRLYLHRGNTG